MKEEEDELLNRLKQTVFKFEVNLTCCNTDEYAFHLDYENKKYRQDALKNIIRRAVMYFALTPKEFKTLGKKKPHELSPLAWTRISTANKNAKGDYGELFLYLILKTYYPAERFVTKVKLRSDQKTQIKGFDCAHFSLDNEGVLNFWLGEAKFWKDFSGAVRDALESLTDHCKIDFIKSEFRILAPNIEINKKLPEYEKLRSALECEHTLEKVRFVFPVLITYDSAAVRNAEDINDDFKKCMQQEIEEKYKYIRDRWKTERHNFRFVFILMPLEAVSQLKDEIDLMEKHNRDV